MPWPRWLRSAFSAPRLTPGIRAEVTLIMGDNGTVGVFVSKLPGDADARDVYLAMTTHWLAFLQQHGIRP